MQVEKQRVNKTIKSQQFEDAKNEYASQLQKTNEAQAKYYNHFKPQVLTNFQDLDERRIKCIQVNRVVEQGGYNFWITQVCFNAQSRFASAILDGVLGPPRQARHT